MVKTDDAGVVFNIGEGSEDFVELESGIGIKTTGSIVPELDGGFGGQDLGDRDSLLLPAYTGKLDVKR